MRIVIIDNYDSFTYNLYHMIRAAGVDVDVKRNDRFALDELSAYDKIVLRPGPGIPDEAGLLKSPQYNATVVFNAIEDYQVLQNGKQIYEKIESGKPDMFKQKQLNLFLPTEIQEKLITFINQGRSTISLSND